MNQAVSYKPQAYSLQHIAKSFLYAKELFQNCRKKLKAK